MKHTLSWESTWYTRILFYEWIFYHKQITLYFQLCPYRKMQSCRTTVSRAFRMRIWILGFVSNMYKTLLCKWLRKYPLSNLTVGHIQMSANILKCSCVWRKMDLNVTSHQICIESDNIQIQHTVVPRPPSQPGPVTSKLAWQYQKASDVIQTNAGSGCWWS